MLFFFTTEKLHPGCSGGIRRLSPGLSLASPLPAHSAADELAFSLQTIPREILFKQQ